MVKRNIILVFIALCSAFMAQGQTTKIKKVVLQAFWWDYKNNNYPNGWANYLAELAPRLKTMGIDAVWIPPTYKNQAPNWVGYGPMDHYDLGDKFQKGSPTTKTGMGTKDELLRMIAVMHANGIEVIQDVVLNHVDGAGTTTGAGGQDPEATYSMASNSGYKNFRYSCYATPAIDESQNDYWTRRGRWAKNYTNFHPNPNNNCNSGDICAAYFGPDIDYSAGSFGVSSNIPTSGTPSGYPAGRTYYNPAQSSLYMYNGATNWIIWYKKQTGVDGFRWDAVKHFPINVQQDLIRQVKYNIGGFNGGYSMLDIGEWIGNKSEIDNYVTNVAAASLSYGYEEHTGTFDFSLRAYGSGSSDENNSLYKMVTSNFSGTHNLASIPGMQQNKRTYSYATPSAIVHRTMPFVNSHDTYRPYLDANGNFLKPLGDATGWNEGQELGGNGKHIDPREPRISAAYAICAAMDGNPVIFFEDVFNLGTTGKRWTHLPTSTTDLPLWNDIENIVKCHQKLQFKEGVYKVRSAEAGAYYPPGSNNGDHLVFERSGKAVVGINDQYSTDQEMWIDSDFAAGTILMDYTGSHGLTTSLVQNDKRVYIHTKAVGHTVSGAFGHGYSVWAPVPGNVAFTSVANMLAYLDYTPGLNPVTTQEWEMDDDLGDSNCSSLGQGGKTPDNSPNDRVVGKIFAKAATTVSYTLTLGSVGNSLTLDFYDLNGILLHTVSGGSASIVGSFTNGSTRWISVKVRNTLATSPGQKCYVRLSYSAPDVVNTAMTPSATTVSIWTSNGGSSDWNDCRNWEEGKIPTCAGTVIIPHAVLFMPSVDACFTGPLINRAGLTVRPKAFLQGPFDSNSNLMNDDLRSAALIPLTSPFGAETTTSTVLSASGNNAIVDWIKVEIRDGAAPSSILYTRSALLQRDGDIVAADGVSPLFFNNATFGNYYVVLRHRNHLPIMSQSMAMDSTIRVADFASGSAGLYSGTIQVSLASGISGMVAGDVDQNGLVSAADRSSVWNDRNLSAYLPTDVGMNGLVSAADRSLVWNNRNLSSTLP